LILALIILAALSAAVWAGLHFYQKSQRDRSANEKNQLFASAISPRMLSKLIPEMESKKHHGFIA
jgi:sensor domain CHASE-containing protein